MAHPAGQRLPRGLQVPFGDESIGRRARAAIEIFVPAADREIRFAAIQIHRQGAARMRQVPQHQRARFMRGVRKGSHVEQLARFVVCVGEKKEGDIPVGRVRQCFARGQSSLGKALPFQPFDHVEIGREVARFAEHDLSPRTHGKRGGDQLEQVYAGGIAGDDFVCPRPDQRCDLGADLAGKIDPARRVPAPDEVPPPLFANHLLQTLGRRFGKAAKGIAIEVNHPFRYIEALPKFLQRIARVETSCALKHREALAESRG